MRKKEFFVISRDEPVCPICGNPLRLRDHKKRIWRKDGGESVVFLFVMIHKGITVLYCYRGLYGRNIISETTDSVLRQWS